jgi:glycosyltransferase involved in cell wall biosynthesis
MRVCYFLSYYQRFTGAQRSLFLLLDALRGRGIQPLVVCPDDGAGTQAFRDAGFAVRIETPPQALRVFGGSLNATGYLTRARVFAEAVLPYARHLATLMDEEGVEMAHFNDLRACLTAGLAARIAGVPSVLHLRGEARWLGWAYLSAAAFLPDRVITVADAVRRSVPLPWRYKCRTVHNGVAMQSGPPSRSRDALLARLFGASNDPRDILVVTVGTMVSWKGWHHVVEAAARLRDRRFADAGGFAFVFVGAAAEEAEYGAFLQSRVEELGLSKIGFAGWDDAPMDWMHAADIVCLPTIFAERIALRGGNQWIHASEGCSRAILEAMACGRPVVATDVAGAREQIVDGTSGLVVPPSDPQALAQAFARLAGDRRLRETMGHAAYHRVARLFTIDQMASKTLEIYDDLRSGRPTVT